MQGRYRITKAVLTDVQRDVLLQEIRFEALVGAIELLEVQRLECIEATFVRCAADLLQSESKGETMTEERPAVNVRPRRMARKLGRRPYPLSCHPSLSTFPNFLRQTAANAAVN